jgi:hypothetical protein
MRANVYVWYDAEIINNNWRYDLTKVTRYERVDEIELPHGWSLGIAESGESYAYDGNGDAYKVIHFGRGNDPLDGHYALAICNGDAPFTVSVKTTKIGIQS